MKHFLNKKNSLNIRIYILYYFVVYGAVSIYGPYISIYYLKSGFSLFQIGILSAIGPLFSVFVQPVWAMISDRTGKRLLVLKAALLGCAVSVLLFILCHGFVQFFAATMLFMMFYTAILPLSDAITVDRVTQAGYKFSVVRMSGSIGYSVGVILLGDFFNRHIGWIFSLTAVTMLLSTLITVLLSEKTKSSHKAEQEEEGPTGPFRPKKLFFLVGYAAVIFLALSFNFSFVGVYAKEMQLSGMALGIVLFASSISEVPVLLLITRFMKQYQRLNILTTLLLAGMLMGFRLLLYYFAHEIVMITFAQFLQGITSMVIYYSMATYINREVPQKYKSVGQSLLAVSQSGVSCILGNVGGGYLSGLIGLRQAYLVMSIFVFGVTVPLMIAWFIRKSSRPRNLDQSAQNPAIPD